MHKSYFKTAAILFYVVVREEPYSRHQLADAILLSIYELREREPLASLLRIGL